MKLNISIITALSFILLVGCNNPEQEQSETANSSISDFEPSDTENVSNLYPDNTEAENEEEAESDTSYVQTEVIERDTVAASITYDVNRRTIEQVDTVGATKKYEVERKVVKKTVLIDTITEVVDKQNKVDFEKGDYQVVNREVAKDSVTEKISNPATATEQTSEAENQVQTIEPRQDSLTDTSQVQTEEIPVEPGQDTTAEAYENQPE